MTDLGFKKFRDIGKREEADSLICTLSVSRMRGIAQEPTELPRASGKATGMRRTGQTNDGDRHAFYDARPTCQPAINMKHIRAAHERACICRESEDRVECAAYFPPPADFQGTAMFSRDLTIARFDADLYAAMEQEAQRQEEHIELIASENYTSPAVMEAQGSVLTN